MRGHGPEVSAPAGLRASLRLRFACLLIGSRVRKVNRRARKIAAGARVSHDSCASPPPPAANGISRRGCARAAPGRLLGVAQVLVDEGDRHAALADRGGDALDRAEAHVAAGEDARDAGLEQVGVARLASRRRSSPRRRRSGRSRARRGPLRRGSQSVSASAPMKTKSPAQGSRRGGAGRAVERCRSRSGGRRRGRRSTSERSATGCSLAADLVDQVLRHALLERRRRARPA